LFRMEVRDLHRLRCRSSGVKLAAACPWGTLGMGGSSRDEVRAVRHYRTGRAW
jgi:hypothetical protein